MQPKGMAEKYISSSYWIVIIVNWIVSTDCAVIVRVTCVALCRELVLWIACLCSIKVAVYCLICSVFRLFAYCIQAVSLLLQLYFLLLNNVILCHCCSFHGRCCCCVFGYVYICEAFLAVCELCWYSEFMVRLNPLRIQRQL